MSAAYALPDEIVPSCPRCPSPLRLVVSEVMPLPDDDAPEERLYLSTYTCSACGWSGVRDEVVERLLRELREAERRAEHLALYVLPRLLKYEMERGTCPHCAPWQRSAPSQTSRNSAR